MLIPIPNNKYQLKIIEYQPSVWVFNPKIKCLLPFVSVLKIGIFKNNIIHLINNVNLEDILPLTSLKTKQNYPEILKHEIKKRLIYIHYFYSTQ